MGGGLISWAFAIPIYSAIVGFEGDPLDAAFNIWTTKIRYLGVGAMVVGGVWSLVKLFKPLIEGIKASLEALKENSSEKEVSIEERDMPINYVGIALAALLIPVFLLYIGIVNSFPIAAHLTVVMMIFGFLFSAKALLLSILSSASP